MRRRGYWGGVAVAVILSSAVACSAHVRITRTVSVRPSSAPPATAEAAVVAYYSAVGRHDWASASALLDSSLRNETATGSDSDRNNIVRLDHLRDLRVAPAAPFPGLPGSYRDITQVFVTYDVVYKKVAASDNGANSRFLYLGRDVKTGLWRILAIGTGP